ncbi:c-type cytochrome [Marinoscillum sp.]|uniref:c-type cytochrome n=1 Tax=Marinoscillum sp. TaxID=2024838 RepID=UPI003BAA7D9E
MQNFKRPIFLILTILVSSCGSSPNKQTADEEPMDRRTEIRLTQYMVQGKSLYQTYCSNCHQADGTGLAKLYPPLAGSDYLMADLKEAACLIKNGKTGEIMVNGVSYNQMMPANTNLTPIEIAEIITYISNSWGNKAGISATRDVTRWLKNCEDSEN